MKKVTRKYIQFLEETAVTNIPNCLTSMLDKEFRVEFDIDTCEGKATRGCLSFEFSIGSENFYIKYEESTKNGCDDILDHLAVLQRAMD